MVLSPHTQISWDEIVSIVSGSGRSGAAKQLSTVSVLLSGLPAFEAHLPKQRTLRLLIEDMAIDLHEDEQTDPFLPVETGMETDNQHASPPDSLRWRVIFIALALIFFAETGTFMIEGPFVRVYEDITCRHWYEKNDPGKFPNGQIPENACKNAAIQSEVAIVGGFQELFNGLVGLACAIPYGNLADKIGRKPVLLLSIPAVWLYFVFLIVVLWFDNIFPLRFVWAGAVFMLIGGGPPVIAALVWTIIADVATEKQRTTAFLQIGVASMGAEFVAGAASGFLLHYDAWLALLTSGGLLCVSMLIIPLFPETRDFGASKKTAINGESYELNSFGSHSVKYPLNNTNSLFGKVKTKLRSIRKESSFILDDPGVMVLLLTFFVYKISRGAGGFFVQYVSTRYGWTIANAKYLTSFKAFINIFLFTSVLPFAAWWLAEKRDIKGNAKEFLFAKVAVILLFIGTVGMGLAPNIYLMIFFLFTQTLGAGYAYSIRSIITTMIESHQVARLYVGITILETAGHLAASPLSAGIFKWGLDLGGGWIGLPFMITGATFLIAALGTWWVSWQHRVEFRS